MICQQGLTGLGFLPAMFFGFLVSWGIGARNAGKECWLDDLMPSRAKGNEVRYV